MVLAIHTAVVATNSYRCSRCGDVSSYLHAWLLRSRVCIEEVSVLRWWVLLRAALRRQTATVYSIVSVVVSRSWRISFYTADHIDGPYIVPTGLATRFNDHVLLPVRRSLLLSNGPTNRCDTVFTQVNATVLSVFQVTSLWFR